MLRTGGQAVGKELWTAGVQANEEGGFCSLENDETCWKNDGVTCMGAEVTERG